MSSSEKSNTRIFIRSVIDSEMCVSQNDGERVFIRIYEAFQRDEKVVLSFGGIKFVISAFLNAALGVLYKYYDSEYLNNNLEIVEITKDQRSMVREVMRNAKEYWSNKTKVQDSLNEAINE